MAHVDNFGDTGKLQDNIRIAEAKLSKLQLSLGKIETWMGQTPTKTGSPVVSRKPEPVFTGMFYSQRYLQLNCPWNRLSAVASRSTSAVAHFSSISLVL